MLAFEETKHATVATVVVESLSFDEKEVHLTQNIEIVVSRNIISRINRANTAGL